MAEPSSPSISPTGPLVVACIAFVFLPLLAADYVWDDDALILQNTSLDGIHAWADALVGGLWTHTPRAQTPPIYYRPVMLWSLAADRLLGGSAVVAHLHSVVWHLVCVALVGRLGRALGLSSVAAWLAAAAFGLHPVAVESVGWVSARNDLLALAGILAAAATSSRPDSSKKFAALALFSAFAAGSKESAYLLPLALLPLLLASRWPVLRAFIATSLGVGTVLAARLAAGVAWPPGADFPHLRDSLVRSVAWGLSAIVAPGVRVPGEHLAWPEPFPWIGAGLGLLGVVLVVWRGGRQATSLFVFALLGAAPAWPAIAHLGAFGDRYLLVPLAGTALAVAVVIDRHLVKKIRRPHLLFALAVPLLVPTVRSLPAWSTDTTLWSTAHRLHQNPHTAGSLAKVYELDGRPEDAVVLYREATTGPIPLQHACWNVAALQVRHRHFEDAARDGERALAAGCPPDPELICPTAYSLAAVGSWPRAIEWAGQPGTDPTGLCVMVQVAARIQASDWTVIEEVAGADPSRQALLLERVAALLRAGGEGTLAEAAESRARAGRPPTGG